MISNTTAHPFSLPPPTNEENLKNEHELKNEDDLNEDDLKN